MTREQLQALADDPLSAIEALMTRYRPELAGAPRTAQTVNVATGLTLDDSALVTWDDVERVEVALCERARIEGGAKWILESDADFVPPRAVAACPRCKRVDAVWAGSSEPCERCQHSLRDEGVSAKRIAAGERTIPAGYAWATLDAKLPAGEHLIEQARVALKAGVRRAVFVGGAGEGKTSLAIAMMRAWSLERGQRVHFAHAHRLGSARLKHKLGAGEADEIALAIEAPLTLIDDLKDEQHTNVSSIYDVIQERHAEGLPTFITTGLGLTSAAAQARIVDIYGDGIARRILEGARIFDFSTKRQAGSRAPTPVPIPTYDPRKRASGDDS